MNDRLPAKGRDEDDDVFVRELRARLRDGETLDAVARARLSAARARAVDEATRRAPRMHWAPWGALGGALAAGLVAAVMLLVRPASPPHGELPSDVAPGEFFELVLDEDPFSDAEPVEDLDVLVWLAGGDRA